METWQGTSSSIVLEEPLLRPLALLHIGAFADAMIAIDGCLLFREWMLLLS